MLKTNPRIVFSYTILMAIVITFLLLISNKVEGNLLQNDLGNFSQDDEFYFPRFFNEPNDNKYDRSPVPNIKENSEHYFIEIMPYFNEVYPSHNLGIKEGNY